MQNVSGVGSGGGPDFAKKPSFEIGDEPLPSAGKQPHAEFFGAGETDKVVEVRSNPNLD